MRYIVERYLPGASLDDLRQLADRVARGALPLGVRHVRSVIAPSDQAIFCEFEGPDEDAIRRANLRAGHPFQRVVPVELHIDQPTKV